jgi:outer membrane protein assembly factor BamB
MRKLVYLTACVTLVSLTLLARGGDPTGTDWPMWGGTPDRNMLSSMKGLPTTWDVKAKKNIKWVAELGSQAYGNPVVANGTVFVGTNNESAKDPEIKGDKGVLMAFRESDGQFLWQAVHDKLTSGRANDWPFQGICSSPLVENGIVYYVSNRGELMAVDADGFRDKTNDGLVKDEKLTRETDVDVIWRYDMMEELGVLQHNMANSSPVSFENLIYVSTSNGQDESHVNVPSPRSPAIIAVDKTTGKLAWEDNSVGEKILHGQWSSPAVGRIGDTVQVVIGQGDGWVRGFEAKSGKKLWEFDLNPKDSVWPKTRNEIISTPVVVDNVVYIANGQDPEHGEGVAHAYAIDATKRGDITQSGRIWHFEKIRRSISTAAVHDGIVYMADFSGFVHALDAKTGTPFWTHDMFAAMWGSPMFIDGKIYIGDEDGDVVVMQAGKELKVLSELNMGSSVYSTPVPANGMLFISNRNMLYALAEGASSTPSAQ